MMIWL